MCQYVKDLVYEFFGGPTTVEDALLGSAQRDSVREVDSFGTGSKKDTLPWCRPEIKGVVSKGTSLVKATIGAVPFVGQLHSSTVLLEKEINKTAVGADKESTQTVAATPPNPILPAILAISSIIAGIAGYLVYSGLVVFPGGTTQSSENKRLSNMGEAGSMLAMVDFGGRDSRFEANDTQAGRVPVGLGVDIAIDERGAF